MLVALLVAIPVAAMTMAVVLIRTNESRTPLEEWERQNGQADARLFGGFGDLGDRLPVVKPEVGPADPPEQPTVELPVGTRVIPVEERYTRVRTAGGDRAFVELSDLPLLDPLTAGIHELVEGRAPTARREIALGANLARRLHVMPGEDLVLDRPDLTLHVVGLVEQVGCLSCPAVLVAPGHLDVVPGSLVGGTVQLLDLPDDLNQAERTSLLEASDGYLQLREMWTAEFQRGEAAASTIRWSFVLGALALTVVAIVISAAFAVGARRQLVTLGQLSASGASPATLRAGLVLQGTVTGVVGAALGLVIAAAALALARGLVEHILDERIDGYVVQPSDLALAAFIGIGAATVAALIPARTAARIPTLSALAGHRPLSPVSRRLIAWGFAGMIGGLALLAMAVVGNQTDQSGDLWAYVAIIGGVAELLGACAIAPAVVARLESLAMRLRGSWRLGARSLARHRSRTGAVVSAVAAAGALAVAASALIHGAEVRAGQNVDVPDDIVLVRTVTFDNATGLEHSVPASEELRADVLAVLPGASETTLLATATSDASSPATHPSGELRMQWEAQLAGQPGVYVAGEAQALLADAATLELLQAGSDLRDAVDEVGIVALHEELHNELLVVTLPDGRTTDGVSIANRYHLGRGSGLLISARRADELGLAVEPMGSAFQADHALTSGERDDIEDVAFDVGDEGPNYAGRFTEVRWSSPSGGPSPFQVELILSGLALVFCLFVVGVSLALAAAESKDERDVLTIAGAPPSTVARSAGARAWLLAGIGGAMAIPIGFLPVIVYSKAEGADRWTSAFPIVFPSRTALVLLVIVPNLVALVAWCTSTTAQRLRPVRVSTATFE
jgi:putative ABC transport system permease protein